MGLRLDIQTDIASAFDTDLSDAVRSLTLKHVTTTSFNPATGTDVPTYVNYTSRGVFDALSEIDLMETPLGLVDTKVIILQNEIDATPALDDQIVDSDGSIYRVIKFGEDPAKCIYELGCRRAT